VILSWATAAGINHRQLKAMKAENVRDFMAGLPSVHRKCNRVHRQIGFRHFHFIAMQVAAAAAARVVFCRRGQREHPAVDSGGGRSAFSRMVYAINPPKTSNAPANAITKQIQPELRLSFDPADRPKLEPLRRTSMPLSIMRSPSPDYPHSQDPKLRSNAWPHPCGLWWRF